MCIVPPFIEEKFDEIGHPGINITSYFLFLKGKLWDNRMVEIDYDNVTTSLLDSLHYGYYQDDKKKTYWRHKEKMSPYITVTHRSARRKCFAIQAPSLNTSGIGELGLYIKKKLFPKTGPSNFYQGFKDGTTGLQYYFHYPGQRNTVSTYATSTNEKWKDRRIGTKNYRMFFAVKNIGVMRYRNKKQAPCVEDWKHYDQFVLDEIMKEVGCRPPHWRKFQALKPSNMSICWNKEQMSTRAFYEQPSISTLLKLPPPCRLMDSVDYVYTENIQKYDLISRYVNKTLQ